MTRMEFVGKVLGVLGDDYCGELRIVDWRAFVPFAEGLKDEDMFMKERLCDMGIANRCDRYGREWVMVCWPE